MDWHEVYQNMKSFLCFLFGHKNGTGTFTIKDKNGKDCKCDIIFCERCYEQISPIDPIIFAKMMKE